MVTFEDPLEADLAAEKVSVDCAPVESGLGLKLALTPWGRPEMRRLTGRAVPEVCGITKTETLAPLFSVAEGGALIVKVSHTVTDTFEDCANAPAVPVTVIL